MNDEKDKSIIQRAIDFAFGKPEAHQPMRRANRKERRTRVAILRKRAAAKKRRKHERRGQ